MKTDSCNLREIKLCEGKRVFVVYYNPWTSDITWSSTQISNVDVANRLIIFEGGFRLNPELLIRLVCQSKPLCSRDYQIRPRKDAKQVMQQLCKGSGQMVSLALSREGNFQKITGKLSKVKPFYHIELENGLIFPFIGPGTAIISLDFLQESDDARYPWHIGCYSAFDYIPFSFNIKNPEIIEEIKQLLFYLKGVYVLSKMASRPELLIDSLKIKPRSIPGAPKEVF